MRTNVTESIRRIRNQPMKSPSPDLNCANKTMKTSSPFKQINQYLYNKTANQKSKHKKSGRIFTNSANQSLIKQLDENNMGRPQKNVQKINKIYQLLMININIQGRQRKYRMSQNQLLDEIYQILSQYWEKQTNNFDTFNNNTNILQQQCKQTVSTIQKNYQDNLKKYQTKIGQLLKQNQQLSNKLFKLNNIDHHHNNPTRHSLSPIYHKNSQTYSVTDITHPNKSQQKYNSPSNLSHKHQQSKSTTSQIGFYRQKILYLQSQLKNKQATIQNLQVQTNKNINKLQQKLQNTNYLLQNQMANYTKIINKLKQRLANYEQKLIMLKDKYGDEQILCDLQHIIQYPDDFNRQTPVKQIQSYEQYGAQSQYNTHKSHMKHLNCQEASSVGEYKSMQDNNEASDAIREYYQNLLQKTINEYKIKLEAIQKQVQTLKTVLDSAYREQISCQNQMMKQKCSNCQILQNKLNLIEIQKIEAQERSNLLQKYKNLYEQQRQSICRTLSKYVQQCGHYEARKQIHRYRNHILSKISKYWNVNLTNFISPSSSLSNLGECCENI